MIQVNRNIFVFKISWSNCLVSLLNVFRFIGVGSFSGPMVQPGSFYITGLLPGVYNMIAQLENGKEVLLPDPVNVGISPSYDLEMTMPGSIFKDTLFGT